MENRSSSFTFEISGLLAMFTTPQSKLNAECISYPFPTYSAIRGMCNMLYKCNGILWVPEACRVMQQIQTQAIAKKTPYYYQKSPRQMVFTYLFDVRYQIKAHYVLNKGASYHPTHNLNHDARIRKFIDWGGNNIVSLGRRECVGSIKPCVWGDGVGYYDDDEEGLECYMFHDFEYDRPCGGRIVYAGFAMQQMRRGIIDFENQRAIYRRYG